MANIAIPIYYKIDLLDGKRRLHIKEKTGIDILFQWTMGGTITDDPGGAGTVTGNLTISNMGNDCFYAITNILWQTNDSSQMLEITADTDRWENLYMSQHANINITLWEGKQNLHSSLYNELLKNIIYLGRPRSEDAAGGRLLAAFVPNTDGEYTWTVLLQGYATKEPLPNSALFQQNPLG